MVLTLINNCRFKSTMPASQKPVMPQSALRTPLNRVLGTETNVRILRALIELGVPMGTSELARHIRMNKAGVWRAIAALEELGAVEAVGLGQQQVFRMRKDYFLTRHLENLFRAERLRFDKLLERLSDVAHSLVPPADSIWVQGSVAMEIDRPGDPLVVAILAPSSQVGRLAETFSHKTTPLQKEFSVAIETTPYTRADIAVMNPNELRSLQTTILLAGLPPLAHSAVTRPAGGSGRVVLHKDRDDRSLTIAQAISARLRRDPTLVRRALAYIKRRTSTASPREAKELQEWRRTLQTYSLAQLRKLLTDTGERATRLRQSSPFLPILSARERAEILQRFEENNRGE